MEKDIQEIKEMTKRMRRRILDLTMPCDFHSHYGPSLSMVEIMAVLYKHVLQYDVNNPTWEERDRFFLSKGHCVLGLYTTLEECGFITKEELDTYQTNYSPFNSHAVMNLSHGIEASSGSLGHGLGLAIGSLLAARRKKMNYRAFVLVGNGECNEGSIWEAAMFAGMHNLENLVAILDYNKDQGDGKSEKILSLEPIEDKWRAFGWNTKRVDGHNIAQLIDTFDNIEKNGKPTIVIADTIKGKGVSFMEGAHEWHHHKMTQEQYEQAIAEVERS